jgi:hypothetical protein
MLLRGKSFLVRTIQLFVVIVVYSIINGCGGDSTHAGFVFLAQSAQWFNDTGASLEFNGSNADPQGFVRLLNGVQLEDGLKYDLSLETHPRWVANGAVEGHFKMTMPAGVTFKAVVGFVKGATTTDGVTFQLYWKNLNPPGNNPPITALQGQLFKTYTNSLNSFTVDLRPIAGQTGELILKVNAGPSSGQDWAVWQSAQIAPFAENDDADKDGLSDSKELALLQEFSPYYKFSQESINYETVQEQYRPTDAIWYVQHSDLLYGGDQNSPVLFKASQLAQDAGMLTNAQWKNGQQSNILNNAKKTSFRLNIYDEYRSGFKNGDGHDWPEILAKGNIGLYGHVVPTRDSDILEVEYWQFFGFNQGNAYNTDIADHEADWCTISMLYRVSTDALISVTYAHHGALTTRLVGPGNMHPVQTSVDGLTELYQEDDFAPVLNLIEFYKGPGENAFRHPVVYVEWGSHEFWPRPADSKTGAPNHDGEGIYHYLTHDVPNLGEVENPLDGASGVIMQFNGRWGAWNEANPNPPGIELHTEWLWPNGSPKNPIPAGDFEN